MYAEVSKDNTIVLLEGGIEAYMLGFYGMTIPTFRALRKAETKYTPVVGPYGAAAGVHRFGRDVIEDLRCCIRDDDQRIRFVWGDAQNHQDQKLKLSLAILVILFDRFSFKWCSRSKTLTAYSDIHLSSSSTTKTIVQLLAISSRSSVRLASQKQIYPTKRTISQLL